MKHGIKLRKLQRTPSHRAALLRYVPPPTEPPPRPPAHFSETSSRPSSTTRSSRPPCPRPRRPRVSPRRCVRAVKQADIPDHLARQARHRPREARSAGLPLRELGLVDAELTRSPDTTTPPSRRTSSPSLRPARQATTSRPPTPRSSRRRRACCPRSSAPWRSGTLKGPEATRASRSSVTDPETMRRWRS